MNNIQKDNYTFNTKNYKIDFDKRKVLNNSIYLLSGSSIILSTVPFIFSWLPSVKTKISGSSIDIDISNINQGEKITIEWRGKPIFIINRKLNDLENLNILNNKLRDPNCIVKQQPKYINNIYRSIKKNIFVVVGICTHLGCVPLYKPNKGDIEPTWPGGFFCPCHGSKFDLSGRVFKNVPAPSNLIIPPHKYLDDKILRIGEE